MRRNLFFLFTVAAIGFITSCKKDDSIQPKTPKTEVPDAFVGRWQVGSFNMGNFYNYDGSLSYSADNDAVSYNLSKDGNAEQFIFYQYDDGSKKQVLAYRKGTVTYDANTKTLKFCPQQGNYRTFINGKKTQDSYGEEGLYPRYSPQYRNCSVENYNQATYLVCISDRNEQLGFRKVNW